MSSGSPGSRRASIESRLLLARASNPEQSRRIGNQTGGRVFLFLFTDDFSRDYRRYADKGVTFVREPKEETYGTVAVFRDPWGNLWDLLQPRSPEPHGEASHRNGPDRPPAVPAGPLRASHYIGWLLRTLGDKVLGPDAPASHPIPSNQLGMFSNCGLSSGFAHARRRLVNISSAGSMP